MFSNRKSIPADVATIKQELNDGRAQILDVREKAEWDAGHLKDAILAPLSMLTNAELPEGVDRQVKTYLHCAAGLRTVPAKRHLDKMGFQDVIALKDGFDELLRGGLVAAD